MQQMTALQHQQQQHLRAQQAGIGASQGALSHMIGGQGGPMAQMNSMNQAMIHMQQQQSMMQQQQNSQVSFIVFINDFVHILNIFYDYKLIGKYYKLEFLVKCTVPYRVLIYLIYWFII